MTDLLDQRDLKLDRIEPITLEQCPPPATGYTDTLLMVIKSSSDGKPAVTYCYRIAERGFVKQMLRKRYSALDTLGHSSLRPQAVARSLATAP